MIKSLMREGGISFDCAEDDADDATEDDAEPGEDRSGTSMVELLAGVILRLGSVGEFVR